MEQVFSLLENGSSVVARKAAAKQIGDVQKKHPEELNALLIKVKLDFNCFNLLSICMKFLVIYKLNLINKKSVEAKA